MSSNEKLIAGLRAAVDASPDNTTVRVHLASLLYAAGNAKDALAHCKSALAGDPANHEAIELAVDAAEASGETVQADGYRRLLVALQGTPAEEDQRPPAPQSAKPPELPQAVKHFESNHDSEQGAKKYGNEDDFEEVPRLRVIQGGATDTDAYLEAEAPEITLADVKGMEEVKRRLNLAFLAPLQDKQLRDMYGKSLRGGLLLYGPPGCGKTHLARATAGELGARFISVGLSDVLDMWIGCSENNLHEMFELARRSQPCLLFFDEVDALGRKRSLMRHSAGVHVVQQMLSEMDGVDSENEGVFVLGATNQPWDVDPALRRPGRFDRTLLVLPPDEPARSAILEASFEGRPTSDLDYNVIARRTDGYSGADLVHLCDSAVEYAMEDSMETGKARPIIQKDLKRARKEVRLSTRPWFDTARNYAQFANEGGQYDDLLQYMKAKKLF